jgi:prepilin-type N-terminal cleavage/methylation domain-containing protein
VLTPHQGRPARRSDAGFTVVELAVVLIVMSIVLVIAGTSLISLDRATSRNDSAVQEEQAASNGMAELENDLRSAATVTIPPGASAADELQLALLGSAGATTNVRWVYDVSAQTLTRQVQLQGSYQPQGYSIADVSNGAAAPVFTYYDSNESDISETTGSNIALCTTAVGIDVQVASSAQGVGAFDETSEVALTNQVQALTAPGNGECGG